MELLFNNVERFNKYCSLLLIQCLKQIGDLRPHFDQSKYRIIYNIIIICLNPFAD